MYFHHTVYQYPLLCCENNNEHGDFRDTGLGANKNITLDGQ